MSTISAMRPGLDVMTTTRSPRKTASGIEWVTNRMVLPDSPRSGGFPGSWSRASWRRARRTAHPSGRWRDRGPGRGAMRYALLHAAGQFVGDDLVAKSDRPTISSSSLARLTDSSLGELQPTSTGSSTLSSTVRQGNSTGRLEHHAHVALQPDDRLAAEPAGDRRCAEPDPRQSVQASTCGSPTGPTMVRNFALADTERHRRERLDIPAIARRIALFEIARLDDDGANRIDGRGAVGGDSPHSSGLGLRSLGLQGLLRVLSPPPAETISIRCGQQLEPVSLAAVAILFEMTADEIDRYAVAVRNRAIGVVVAGQERNTHENRKAIGSARNGFADQSHAHGLHRQKRMTVIVPLAKFSPAIRTPPMGFLGDSGLSSASRAFAEPRDRSRRHVGRRSTGRWRRRPAVSSTARHRVACQPPLRSFRGSVMLPGTAEAATVMALAR